MKKRALKLLSIFLEKNKHVCKGPRTCSQFQKEIIHVLSVELKLFKGSTARPNRSWKQGLHATALCLWQSLEIGTKIKSSWVQPVLNVRWNTLLSRQCTMLIFPLGSALLCEMLNQVLVSAFTKIRAGKQLVPQLIFCDVIALNFNWARFLWTCFFAFDTWRQCSFNLVGLFYGHFLWMLKSCTF